MLLLVRPNAMTGLMEAIQSLEECDQILEYKKKTLKFSVCLLHREGEARLFFEGHSNWVRLKALSCNKQNLDWIWGEKITVMVVKHGKRGLGNLETPSLELLETKLLEALNHLVHRDPGLSGVWAKCPLDVQS